MEKCLARIQLWLPETTYQDALAEAADDDRSLSEYCRHVLTQHLRQVCAHVEALTSGDLGTERDGYVR